MAISASPSFRARLYDSLIGFLTGLRNIDYSNYRYHREKIEQLSRLLPRIRNVSYLRAMVGSLPAEWITPDNAKLDTILYYLHGGGYVICSINTHRNVIARIAKTAGIRAFTVDYRLAPEHPFPAAVEDAVKGYEYLLEKGFDPKKIIIAGDSAGGGLTIVTLLSLRDKGIPLPVAAVCIAPWTDLEGVGNSHIANAKYERILTLEAIKDFGKLYAGTASIRNPLVSPIYADLTGLPPLLIQVSKSEMLLDDSVRLHEKALADGVDSTLEQWSGLLHVWHVHPFLPESRKAIRHIAEFINRVIG